MDSKKTESLKIRRRRIKKSFGFSFSFVIILQNIRKENEKGKTFFGFSAFFKSSKENPVFSEK